MITVFYIDDNEADLELVSAALALDTGFELTTFKTLESLYQSLEMNSPDIIILDMNLGVSITGSLAASQLKYKAPNSKLIIYTNYDVDFVQKLIPKKEFDPHSLHIWQKTSIDIMQLGTYLKMIHNA